jgi:hypothetical protein
MSLRLVQNLGKDLSIGVVDTSGKFASEVKVAGGLFAAVIVDIDVTP